jgi:hypothetical protein
MGFVPIRKKGKLPFTTVQESYELEYGSATVEMHTDAVKPGDRVVLIDDLIATGGTMMAGRRLLERLGAQVIEGAAIVDLPELGGSTTAARHRAGRCSRWWTSRGTEPRRAGRAGRGGAAEPCPATRSRAPIGHAARRRWRALQAAAGRLAQTLRCLRAVRFCPRHLARGALP